jgi:acyl carrier protein
MLAEDKKAALLKELAGILEVEESELEEHFVLTEERWDSLALISTIAAIDDLFGVSINGKELRDLKTVGEILSVVSRQTN